MGLREELFGKSSPHRPAGARPPPATEGPATFVAIDFETADYQRDSACAVGLVRVQHGRIVEKTHLLIQPPRRRFVFSELHGITWAMVAREPTFVRRWPQILELIRDADFLAAHSAPFDRSVMNACCREAGLAVPEIPFTCTVKLARETWGIYPTRLPDVCAFLGIELRHHEALSDAEACARIVLAAERVRTPRDVREASSRRFVP